MKNIPKKHHYIPKFFLNNFLSSKTDMLSVLDQKSGKSFRSKPQNIAYKNHLYSVDKTDDNVDVDVDDIEKLFSKIESLVAPIICEIEKSKILPIGDDFNTLINFIALASCRVPVMTELSMKPIKEISIMSLKMAMSSKDRYKKMLEEIKKEGIDLGDGSDYENVLEFLNSDRYKVKINQNFKLKSIFDSVEILVPLLGMRKWSLIITDDSNGGFICSDNPVSLVSLVKLPQFMGPGFGMKNTEVSIPLSKNLAVIGRFEGVEEVGYAPPQALAAINSRTGMYADKFIFSATDNFLYITKEGQVGNRDNLICDIIQKKKEK